MHEKGDRGGNGSPPLREPGGEAFEYTRRRFAPPFFFGCTGPLFFSDETNQDYRMDFWMYFGFVYGILFDGRIPARQSLGRKHSVCLAEVVDFVANPPTKCTKRGTGAEEWSWGGCVNR